jgi:hypothetical protein
MREVGDIILVSSSPTHIIFRRCKFHCVFSTLYTAVLLSMPLDFLDPRIKVGFDFHKSTRDNYTDPSATQFGDFADVRRDLDSQWHGCYCLSRQLLQDGLVKEALGLNRGSQLNFQEHAHPLIVYTGGAMGAGKGYTMAWMSRNGIVSVPNLRHIDPDVFRRRLPEWKYYVKLNQATAGSLTHLESSMIAEIAQAVALQKNMNIWIDGSLSDYDWFVTQLRRIRHLFPQYRIAVVHVAASERVIMQRCENRAQTTGRVVPLEKIRFSLHASRETVLRVAPPFVDVVAMVENEGREPKLVSINHEPVGSDDWALLSKLLNV